MTFPDEIEVKLNEIEQKVDENERENLYYIPMHCVPWVRNNRNKYVRYNLEGILKETDSRNKLWQW